MPIRPTRTSKRGVRFIAEHEGYEATPYNDAAGNATIGYGHLLHRGPVNDHDRRTWRGFTEARGRDLLARDLRAAELSVLATVRPPFVLPFRFDALVSFVFNLGPEYIRPGHTMGDALASRSRRGAGAAFGLYTHAGGVELPGLVRRRADERRLFLSGRYS